MVFRNLIFQPEVVEQRLRPVVLSHHDQQASDDQNQTEHGQMLSSNMLLLNLILLIDVTFSTPTGYYANYGKGLRCARHFSTDPPSSDTKTPDGPEQKAGCPQTAATIMLSMYWSVRA